MTGIPGKAGVVDTLDRETGEFLWANPTVARNMITHLDGANRRRDREPEVIFSAPGQERLGCPSWADGKDWEAGAYSPLIHARYFPLLPLLRAGSSRDHRVEATVLRSRATVLDLAPVPDPAGGPPFRPPARRPRHAAGGRRGVVADVRRRSRPTGRFGGEEPPNRRPRG